MKKIYHGFIQILTSKELKFDLLRVLLCLVNVYVMGRKCLVISFRSIRFLRLVKIKVYYLKR